MAIPDYQSCMLPLLQYAADGKEHKFSEAVADISNIFHLTEEERTELLPSGTQYIIVNRIGWARTYLKKAGLLSDPQRSYFQITDRGKEVLAKKPKSINTKDLQKYDEFNIFQKNPIIKPQSIQMM